MTDDNPLLTAEEEDLLEWCYANLEEEHITDCVGEAAAIAARDINEPIAAELLAALLAKVMVRRHSLSLKS